MCDQQLEKGQPKWIKRQMYFWHNLIENHKYCSTYHSIDLSTDSIWYFFLLGVNELRMWQGFKGSSAIAQQDGDPQFSRMVNT